MEFLKIITTVLNILLLICILWFAKGQKDKACRIGFGAMIVSYVLNTLLIWN